MCSSDLSTSDGKESTLTLEGDSLTGVDIALERGARISGRITLPAGMSTENSCLWVSATPRNFKVVERIYSAPVNKNGTYAIPDMSARTDYVVDVVSRSWCGDKVRVNIAQTFYGDTLSADAARRVDLSSGDVSGVDIHAVVGGVLTGVITADDPADLDSSTMC